MEKMEMMVLGGTELGCKLQNLGIEKVWHNGMCATLAATVSSSAVVPASAVVSACAVAFASAMVS